MNRVLNNNREVSVQYGTADLTIPPGLRNITQLISHQVLKVQPSGAIIDFIADYLKNLLSIRETTGYDPAIHGDMLERIQAYYYQMYGNEPQTTRQPGPQVTINYEKEEISVEYDFEVEFVQEAAAPDGGVAVSSEDVGDAMASDAVEETSSTAPVKVDEMAVDTATEQPTDIQPDDVVEDKQDDVVKDNKPDDVVEDNKSDDVVEDNPAAEEPGDTEVADASDEQSSNTAEKEEKAEGQVIDQDS